MASTYGGGYGYVTCSGDKERVSQRPNLRHLCEPLWETEGLIETVGFKKTTECMARMPEFQTEGVCDKCGCTMDQELDQIQRANDVTHAGQARRQPSDAASGGMTAYLPS